MAKDKKTKAGAPLPKTGGPNAGAQSMGSMQSMNFNTSSTTSYSYAGTGAIPTIPKTDAKDKKKKTKDKSPIGNTQPNISSLSPDQLNQLQLEEAIKESQNPSMKLKKLKNPLSVGGCLLNLVFFVVLTLVFVFLYIWIFKVQHFDFFVIAKDMLDKFGITQFFSDLFTRIGNLFTGKGWTLNPEEIIKMFL